jgi:hypothetical protein
MINRWSAFGFLAVFHTLHSSNCSRLRVMVDFQPSKIKPEGGISLLTPPTEIHKSERQAAIGFLLVFYTLHSSKSSRPRLIIDYQCSKIRLDAEMSLTWRHQSESI